MKKLTQDDFVREIAWLLYSNKDTLPESLDIESDDPFKDVPTFILDALARDYNDPNLQHFAVGLPSHYNWTMFCVLEDTWEFEQTP